MHIWWDVPGPTINQDWPQAVTRVAIFFNKHKSTILRIWKHQQKNYQEKQQRTASPMHHNK
jgi:hypothetical protein